MGALGELWALTISEGRPPPMGLLFFTFCLALLLVASPLWKIIRNGLTIAHEGGHALVGLLMGRRLQGVRLHSDTSGVTISRGKPHGLGVIFTVFAGYPSPALVGLALYWLVLEGHSTAALLGSTLLLSLMFLMVRNPWGFLTVGVSAIILYFASSELSLELQGVFVSLLAWMFLLGSVRPLWELQQHRWRGEAPDSDPDQLRKLSFFIPAEIWLTLMGVINVGAILWALQLTLNLE